jgi:hypothetical protein
VVVDSFVISFKQHHRMLSYNIFLYILYRKVKKENTWFRFKFAVYLEALWARIAQSVERLDSQGSVTIRGRMLLFTIISKLIRGPIYLLSISAFLCVIKQAGYKTDLWLHHVPRLRMHKSCTSTNSLMECCLGIGTTLPLPILHEKTRNKM